MSECFISSDSIPIQTGVTTTGITTIGVTTGGYVSYDIQCNPWKTSDAPILMQELPDNTKNNTKHKRKTMRILDIYIIDENNSIKPELRLIKTIKSYVTDLNDDEVKMSLGIGAILTEYNKTRETYIDEKKTEKLNKEVKLKPATVKDIRVVIKEQVSI